jgi:hypothetical protein
MNKHYFDVHEIFDLNIDCKLHFFFFRRPDLEQIFFLSQKLLDCQNFNANITIYHRESNSTKYNFKEMITFQGMVK